MFDRSTSRNLSSQDANETKSEYRNTKQTYRQINRKSRKSKPLNPKRACLEFFLFWSFEIVLNFGSFGKAQDRFCPSKIVQPGLSLGQAFLCFSNSINGSEILPKPVKVETA